MVGNISDIKILMATNEYRPAMPGSNIAPALVITPPIEKYNISLAPLIYFKSQVHIQRPERKEIIAAILYQVAVSCSSGGLVSFICATYLIIKVLHII